MPALFFTAVKPTRPPSGRPARPAATPPHTPPKKPPKVKKTATLSEDLTVFGDIFCMVLIFSRDLHCLCGREATSSGGLMSSMTQRSALSVIRSISRGGGASSLPATALSIIPTHARRGNKPNPHERISFSTMSSKEFNANWLVKVQWQEINGLLGYSNLVSLLDDCAPRVLARLAAFKGEKLTCKPFHGAIITFYSR